MALFNFFNKKKKAEKKEVKKAVKKEMKEKAPAQGGSASGGRPKKDSESAYRILKWPHVTEKATNLTKINQYVFNVYERSNKPEIKRTIEDVYGVSVTSVKIIKIPAKKRRLGKIEGWRKGYKKAIVRLAEGQKIEVLPR